MQGVLKGHLSSILVNMIQFGMEKIRKVTKVLIILNTGDHH